MPRQANSPLPETVSSFNTEKKNEETKIVDGWFTVKDKLRPSTPSSVVFFLTLSIYLGQRPLYGSTHLYQGLNVTIERLILVLDDAVLGHKLLHELRNDGISSHISPSNLQ